MTPLRPFPLAHLAAVALLTLSTSAGAGDLAGLWTGATSAGTAIEVLVTDQDPDGGVRGKIELQPAPDDLVQYVAFTGVARGSELVLTAPELRLVLTVDRTRMTGRAETPGRPDLTVSLVAAGPDHPPTPPSTPRPSEVSDLVARAWSDIARDPAGSLGLFERAIAADPSSAQAHYGRGYVHLQLANTPGGAWHREQATASLCRALDLGDRDAGGLLARERITCLPLLAVRCNRRVLVYVDDRAIGYTPQDVPVSVGNHRVVVKIPGMPSSVQSRQIDVYASQGVEFTL